MSFKCSPNASFTFSRIDASRSFYVYKMNVHLKQVVLIFHFVHKLDMRLLQKKDEHVRRESADVGFHGNAGSCIAEQT